MENEKKFQFSEMYIFGKFDTFSKRLQKIIDMFETFELYSYLSDSKIEGMDESKFEKSKRSTRNEIKPVTDILTDITFY